MRVIQPVMSLRCFGRAKLAANFKSTGQLPTAQKAGEKKVGSVSKYGSNFIIKQKSQMRKFRFSGTLTDVHNKTNRCFEN